MSFLTLRTKCILPLEFYLKGADTVCFNLDFRALGWGAVNKTKILRIFKRQRISLVAHLVKNLPTMWETWVQSLGWEHPLEKGTAIHPSILAWRIPWTV